jgi:quercetin dioxygenase-like cupin family protein
MKPASRIIPLVAVTVALLMPWPAISAEYGGSVKTQKLLVTTTAGNGQLHRYLTTDWPEVTAMTVEIAPGGETGWHLHTEPVYAYVLAGSLRVDLAGGKVLDFKEGDAIIEVQNLAHNGKNTGKEPVRLIVFYTGEVGRPLSVRTEAPQR